MAGMRKGRKIVIANWKMNPLTVGESKKIFLDIKKSTNRLSNVQTVVCPPVSFLAELRKLYIGKKIEFGVQNIHFEKIGPFTGEVSASMAKSVGAAYSIIGHSERRAMGETNEMISKKIPQFRLLREYNI